MSAGTAHRLALLQEGEAALSPAHLAVWRHVVELLPSDSELIGAAGGYGLEIWLMKHVAHGAKLEELRRYIPKSPRVFDRKLAAAGELVVASQERITHQ